MGVRGGRGGEAEGVVFEAYTGLRAKFIELGGLRAELRT